MPTISAACHQVIFFAIARRITSCTFIARSTAALGYVSTLTCMEISSPPAKRTFHVLIPPDISCVNDTHAAGQLTSPQIFLTVDSSAKGASSPRKGPCPPSLRQSDESSFSLIHADSQASVERSFVCLTENYPPVPTSNNTKNKPKTLPDIVCLATRTPSRAPANITLACTTWQKA